MSTLFRRHQRNGLDMQGRFPEAAHAATDVGHDDMEGAGVIVTPVVVLALIAVISLTVWVMP